MDIKNTDKQKLTEYSFQWGKQFTFLTLKTIDTKLVINSTSLHIEMSKYYLGLFRAKSTILDIPTDNISHLTIKKILSLPDLIIAVIYMIGGFFNPLFFIIVPLSIWACINTNIIMSTKTDTVIKIPSCNKKDALEFINYINDLFIEA